MRVSAFSAYSISQVTHSLLGVSTFGLFITAISITAAIGSRLLVGGRLRIAIAAVTPALVIAAYGYLYFGAVKGNDRTLREAGAFFGEGRRVSIRSLRDETELQQLWRLDERVYGPESLAGFTYNHMMAWWRRYRNGAYVALFGGEAIAALGLWPVTETALRELIAGRRTEWDLAGCMIVPSAKARGDQWWVRGRRASGPKRATTADTQAQESFAATSPSIAARMDRDD
jgi:hypothetical protein